MEELNMPYVLSMLTEHDITIPNADLIFEQNKHSKVKYWGFKDVGISQTKRAALARLMLNAGKKTVYEALTTDEDDCLEHAKFAVDCQVSMFLGMTFFERVSELLKQNNIDYFPSVGKREGDNLLRGSAEEMIKEAQFIQQQDCHGIRLSVFRYLDGDPEEMGLKVLGSINIPFLITGSINTYQKLDFIKRVKPFGFTIGGSLLFTDDFAKGSVAEKLDIVKDYVQNQ